MVVGAGWAGARAMTSTSGPGISLMGEFAGLAYYAEVPGVVFDIQRVGPSTGLPTRTAQGDIFTVATLSHGDTKQVMLIPASAEECYTMAMDAFDLAERFQTLVFVMSDLDLGMNTWMSKTFAVSRAAARSRQGAGRGDAPRIGEWGRYKDVDGDGIPYRTIPAPACRRTSRADPATTRRASTASVPTTTSTTSIGSARKFETARTVRAEAGRRRAARRRHWRSSATARSHWAIDREPRSDRARKRACATGVPAPARLSVHDGVAAFIERYTRVYVVEQNRDAQMLGLMRLELTPAQIAKLRSVLHYNGLPIDARSMTDEILIQEGRKVRRCRRSRPCRSSRGVGG